MTNFANRERIGPAPAARTRVPLEPAVLQRHGARVLGPDAPLLSGQRRPRPTAYRAGVLLASGDVLRDEVLDELNKALSTVGLVAKRVPRGGDRLVRLLLAPTGRVPVTVDAWLGLQAVRAQDRNLAARLGLGLDHLLFAAALRPYFGGTEGAWHGSPGEPGPATAPVGYGGPTPVWLARPPAVRRDDGHRRPVVAVLDSGIYANAWLNVTADGPAKDSIVRVNKTIQGAIEESGLELAELDETAQVLYGVLDPPASRNPLTGELECCSGHGTFVAGLIAQAAPDADILAIRVMHPDGVVYESDLVTALEAVLARTGQSDGVDVLCLSLGCYAEAVDDAHADLAVVKRVLMDLRREGVTVVAAAGNDATDEPFYPAAWSEPAIGTVAALDAVGALNPNASHALFTNSAAWVTHDKPGAAVVSTFPQRAPGTAGQHGAANPAQSVGPAAETYGVLRESFDPDDFASGWACWSGTSFAAPLRAAEWAAGRGVARPAPERPDGRTPAGTAGAAVQPGAGE